MPDPLLPPAQAASPDAPRRFHLMIDVVFPLLLLIAAGVAMWLMGKC